MAIPFIDLKKQYETHKSDLDAAVNSVLDHGQYIMGPEVQELESKLASFIGVEHVLACSSGTDALVLPLMTYGLQKEDAVFTSPFTFFASAESISLAGATPVFVDIDPKTYNLCPEALEEAIHKTVAEGKLRPRGIVPVDLFGIAADYSRITKIAESNNLFVLEDAAQAFGAKSGDKRACSFGDVAATSFYPAKPLGCYGDGGAVFTNDTEMYEKMVSLRVHGQSAIGGKYDNVRIGLNARMDTIQAAILLKKLHIYEEEIALRQSVAEKYTVALSEFVQVPHIPPHQESVWAQYSIQVENREQFQLDLKAAGVPTAVFYPIPIHLSTAYKHLNYQTGDFPNAEAISKKIVSLPMHPYLSDNDIERICEVAIGSIKSN